MSVFQKKIYRNSNDSSINSKPRILFYTLHYPPGVGGSIFYEEGLRKALLENYHITVITPNRGYAGLKPTNGELNTQSGVWEIRRKYMVLPDFFLPKKWPRRLKKIAEVFFFDVNCNLIRVFRCLIFCYNCFLERIIHENQYVSDKEQRERQVYKRVSEVFFYHKDCLPSRGAYP